jgi:hypothetical protein
VVTATGTGPYLATGGTTLGVTFRTTTCTTPYTAASPIVGTTATKNVANTVATFTVPATLPAAGAYNVCIYAGTANTSALLGSSSFSALPTSSVSPTSGNSGGGNTIIVTTKTATMAAGTSPGGYFTSATSCPASYDLAGVNEVAASTVTRISTTKVALGVPGGVTYSGTGETTTWNTCLYANNTTGKLIAVPTGYSVATALDLTGVTIDPSGGPAQGGSAISVTVAGGLPTATGSTISASLGGSILQNVVVTSATTFTATTTPHAAGATKLSVTTAAGTQVSSTTPFTYSYGITVTPNQAKAASTSVTLDVLGSGFDALTFAGTSDATVGAAPGVGAAVFLVDNGWYTAMAGTDTIVATGLVSQCMTATKISDTELICTLDLTKSLDASAHLQSVAVGTGVYNVALVNDATLTTTLAVDSTVSRVSSGSTFVVAEY